MRTNVYRVSIPSTSVTYTYDGNGNLQTKTQAGSTWLYEWSARNELLRVLKDGAELARFAYDGLGRRVEKVAAGVTTRYVYDRDDIVREVKAGVATTYVHGPGIDEPFARADSSGGLTGYFHADGLGSIVATTNSSGSLVSSLRYDGFGNIEAGSTAGPFAFTGREWDGETGLYYYRARYYDPTVGRFIREDPIGYVAGINLYTYALNRPQTLSDPGGTDVWIEGPSFQEPAGHQSINVGDPNRAYDSYSFGVNRDPGLVGEVYKDVSHGGEIDSTHYLYTTPAEDALVKAYLDAQLGNKAGYRPWRTCRNFSQDQFDLIKNMVYSGPVLIAPSGSRPVFAPQNPTAVPSSSRTLASDAQNAKDTVSSSSSSGSSSNR
jgi:RHS repeat-associated protein